MPPKVLAQLLSNTHGLSPALARIANYVRQAPDQVIYQTITELSEHAKSSEASVIRFCRDIGFHSFADFKMALAMELRERDSDNNQTSNEPEGVKDAINALTNTAELVDSALIEQISQWVYDAPRIIVFGVGASSIIASYIEYRLVRMGLPAKAYNDMHVGVMAASRAEANSVALFVSSTGSTVDIVRAATLAAKKGLKVVGLSNTRKSPLAKVADSLLVASSPESPLTAGKLASKVGQLLLVDMLATDLYTRFEPLQVAHQETADATSELLY